MNCDIIIEDKKENLSDVQIMTKEILTMKGVEKKHTTDMIELCNHCLDNGRLLGYGLSSKDNVYNVMIYHLKNYTEKIVYLKLEEDKTSFWTYNRDKIIRYYKHNNEICLIVKESGSATYPKISFKDNEAIKNLSKNLLDTI